MKNNYKKFVSLFRSEIKYNISMIRHYNNNFYLTDFDIAAITGYQNKLKDIKNMFNLLFDKNLSLKQFVSMFNWEV